MAHLNNNNYAPVPQPTKYYESSILKNVTLIYEVHSKHVYCGHFEIVEKNRQRITQHRQLFDCVIKRLPTNRQMFFLGGAILVDYKVAMNSTTLNGIMDPALRNRQEWEGSEVVRALNNGRYTYVVTDCSPIRYDASPGVWIEGNCFKFC